jgi:hypothetical protein
MMIDRRRRRPRRHYAKLKIVSPKTLSTEEQNETGSARESADNGNRKTITKTETLVMAIEQLFFEIEQLSLPD